MGMRLLALAAVLLAGCAVVRHSGVQPLLATQQLLQQRQQQPWRQQQHADAVSSSSSSAAQPYAAAEAAPSRRRLIEESGAYGYGGYGYGGYGYGSSGGGRRLQQQAAADSSSSSGSIPTIYYDDEAEDGGEPQQAEIVAAGLAHDEGIELTDDAATDSVSQPEQQKAARKLLLSSSHIQWQQLEQLRLAPEADIVLPDPLLDGPSSRSLLATNESYGSYGGYGYGGYGYGGYGGAHRHLLSAVEDDVQLYTTWLQQRDLHQQN